VRLLTAALILAALVAPPGATAQVRPDTIARPRAAADTLPRTPPDSAAPAADSTGAPADTASADTIFHNLPAIEGGAPQGWATGVWVWDHDGLMTTGATSVAELLAEVPGIVTLLGGDYGTPAAAAAFGAGGGRVRIVRDGFELTPLDGSIPDLDRVGLGGIAYVRVERHPGGILIEMESMKYDDGVPYSLIEAGTGDLNSNMFRGSYTDPTSLGGSIALALERSDTQGPGGREAGNRTGSWLRYQLHHGDDAGIALDFRRMANQTAVADYLSKARRTDLVLRGRMRLADGLVAGAYWGRSTLKSEDVREGFDRIGGSRSQWGLRASLTRGPLWVRGAYRSFGGDDLPASRWDLRSGVDDAELGGLAVDLEGASWAGRSTSTHRFRAWTAPIGGVSLFASRESGDVGARTGPLLLPPPADTTTGADTTSAPTPALPDSVTVAPAVRFSDRTATRYGAIFRWRGVALSGARLSLETDSLLPFGLLTDRAGSPLPGGKRTGWEVWARLPMPLDGLHVEGSLQQWDSAWSYMPEQIYRGAFVYHDTFLPSGDLELWWTLGVRGRDPMTVRILGDGMDEDGNALPASVPFYQNWYARIQVRIVTVRIFVQWENFTIRRNLQDFPGRILPATRAFYGVRWTMRN